MSLTPPQAYRSTANTHRVGERADQPLATDVLAGTLYYVSDEGITERSDGAVWSAYSGSGSRTSNLVNYSYSVATGTPPSTNQVRFNAGFPYTAVTALYFDDITADGQDIRVGLLRIPPGSLIYVQDKNDDTMSGTFLTTTFPIDHTTWVEFTVVHYAHGAAIGGGQLALVQSTWGPITTPVFTADSVPFANASGQLTQDNPDFTYTESSGALVAPLPMATRSTFPRFRVNETGQAANSRLWRMMAASQIFYIQPVVDDESTATDGITLNRSGFISGLGQPACAVTNSAVQSIADTTITALTFDTEIFDRGGCHSGGSPGRLTVPTGGDGIYIAQVSTDYTPNVTGLRLGRIRKNGATNVSTSFQTAVVGDATICQCVAIMNLVAGDYIESIAYQTSGGALNVRATTDTSLAWVKVW
ncbi:MAG: hypothetical protein ABWY25_10900 [Paenisporosarcina sp.]